MVALSRKLCGRSTLRFVWPAVFPANQRQRRDIRLGFN